VVRATFFPGPQKFLGEMCTHGGPISDKSPCMTTRTHIFVVLASLTLAIAGCQGPGHKTPGVVVGEDTITIEQLALRLGLRIEQRDPAFVVMKNAANTVIVFTHTDGRFFVNGKPMGSVGSVTIDHGVVRVPATLPDQIRPFLRTGFRNNRRLPVPRARWSSTPGTARTIPAPSARPA
jgi:hypothetical protein